MFKPKLSKQEQGFTLVEVLVAILIATIFITVAMQMMVIASVFKVKAQENTEATTWIQEDLETVRYQAGKLLFTALTGVTTAGASSIIVRSPNNSTDLAVNGTLKIGSDSGSYKITGISGPALNNVTGINETTLNITPQLTKTQVANAAIAITTRCSAGQTDGLADALRDAVIGSNQTTNSNDVDNPPSSGNNQSNTNAALSSKLFTNKRYTLRRKTTLSASSPYNVLQLKYEVSQGTTFDATQKIATFYTEVIPNVAFQCPQ